MSMLDTIEEIYREREAREAQRAQEAENPLAALFADTRIRLAGDVQAPLFCAADVAARIGDANFRRAVAEYPPKFKQRATAADSRGHKQEMVMLTEQGLYRYLLKSKRQEAEAFQEWVYDHLTAARRQLVDSAKLAAKIASDKEKLAQDRYWEAVDRADRLARENRSLRKAAATRPFCQNGDTSWPDYQDYCLARYKAEHRALPRLGAWQTLELNELATSYYNQRSFEEGYEAIRSLLDGALAPSDGEDSGSDGSAGSDEDSESREDGDGSDPV